MNDLISRQEAISAVNTALFPKINTAKDAEKALLNLPSVQPTLYGYDIKHLMLIAEVLRKENLPPERVTETLMDIRRIVSIVSDEFEESLRETMKQCKI